MANVWKLAIRANAAQAKREIKSLGGGMSKIGGPAKVMAAAFVAAGLAQFVLRRFNANTVSAWYREATAEGESIPSTLEDVLDVNERITLRVRST